MESTVAKSSAFEIEFNNRADGVFKIETLNPISDPNRVNGLRTGQAGTSGLDPILTLRTTFRKIGAGLENLGNTCFLNSVLQCLTYTEPLVAYLQSGKHQNSCRIAGFCALCAMQKHVSRALQSTGRILAPNYLVSNLRCISRNFRNSRQEDAHEYMVNLLESMHKCCLPSGVPTQSPGAYEKSLVHKIFGGRLCSQVKCLQCSYCSNTFDPFLDLSLEIDKADSLHKALRNFTAAEQLDGGERQYQCQCCKQKVRATKQLTVYDAPNVLTIHLKRFQAHNLGQKIDRKVEFGVTIDMKPFVSGSNEGSLKYTLYGVLVHRGWSTHSGHYYCFVRTSSGTWYSLDDNMVRAVNERVVLEQKAYMLFYVRDRRNRNPVDSLHIDNVKANVNGNSIFNRNPKEYVQTGPIQDKLSALGTSTAVPQKDTVNGGLSKGKIMKEVPSQQDTVQPMEERLVLKKESILPSSDVLASLKDSLQASASNPIHDENLQPTAGSAVGNVMSSNIENSTVTNITGDKDSNCNETGNCEKEYGVPLMTSLKCGGLQNLAADKIATEETLHKVNLAPKTEVSNIVALEDSIDKAVKTAPAEAPLATDEASKNVHVISSPNKPNCDSNKIRDVSYHSSSNKSLNENVDHNSKKIISKSPLSIPNGSLDTEETEFAPCRKLKKHLKRQLNDIPVLLQSKFFMASLRLVRSKKKRRRNKKPPLNEHVLCKGISMDKDRYSSDLGPSTSEKSRTIAAGLVHGRKMTANDSTQKNGNNSASSWTNTVAGASKEKFYENGTVLATDQHIGRSSVSVSEANRHSPRETDSLKHSKTGASPVNQGLGEKIVPRSDDIEIVSATQTVELNGMDSLGIGYGPDEWDEEYDRGKRKKKRQNKHEFGGPNLLQQVATKKTQLKKAKLHHSKSGNQPFRI